MHGTSKMSFFFEFKMFKANYPNGALKPSVTIYDDLGKSTTYGNQNFFTHIPDQNTLTVRITALVNMSNVNYVHDSAVIA